MAGVSRAEGCIAFIRANPNPIKEEIHRHAGQLIYEFRLFGPILTYKLWTLHPPSIQAP